MLCFFFFFWWSLRRGICNLYERAHTHTLRDFLYCVYHNHNSLMSITFTSSYDGPETTSEFSSPRIRALCWWRSSSAITLGRALFTLFYLLLKLKHCTNNKCCDINKIYCFISPPNDKKLSFYHFFPSSLSCACLSSFVGLASFFAKHGVRRWYGMEIVEAFRIVIFYQFEMRWKKWYFHGRNLWCENINNSLAQLFFLSFSHDTKLCLSIALREEEENRN